MTFSTWKASLLSYLDTDATRRGIESLRNGFIRGAVSDLKHFVPCFVDGRESYEDNDVVPFDEKAAEVAAMYVKARIVRITEKDLSLAASFMGDYVTGRRLLIRRCSEQTATERDEVALVATRGDTFLLDIFLLMDGTAINPTGHEVRFTVKSDTCSTDDDAVLNKSTAATVDEPVPAITITDGPTGKLLLTLSPADTAELQPGVTYRWDVTIFMSTGEIHTVLSGSIRTRQDVTIEDE